MRQLMIVAVAMIASVVPALAQEQTPRVDVFGGYQFTHLTPSINAHGWNTAINGNINRWFGFTGDFSGAYKKGGHMDDPPDLSSRAAMLFGSGPSH